MNINNRKERNWMDLNQNINKKQSDWIVWCYIGIKINYIQLNRMWFLYIMACSLIIATRCFWSSTTTSSLPKYEISMQTS